MTRIAIAPFADVRPALRERDFTHVVSILGASDGLEWPATNGRPSLRLWFDDVAYSSGPLVAASTNDMQALIDFMRAWGG